jgi:hypothetical protein
MALDNRSLDILIAAHDNASGTMRQVGKSVDELDTKIRRAGKSDGGLIGRLDSIKQTFGGRGPVKDVLEAFLVGGGAVAGLSFGANVLAQGAKSFEDASAIAATGETTITRMTQGAVSSLPILGRLVDATKSMLDGLQDFSAAMARELGGSEQTVRMLMSSETLLKLQAQEAKLRREASNEIRKQAEAFSGRAAASDAFRAVGGIADPIERDRILSEAQVRQRQLEIDREAEKQSEELRQKIIADQDSELRGGPSAGRSIRDAWRRQIDDIETERRRTRADVETEANRKTIDALKRRATDEDRIITEQQDAAERMIAESFSRQLATADRSLDARARLVRQKYAEMRRDEERNFDKLFNQPGATQRFKDELFQAFEERKAAIDAAQRSEQGALDKERRDRGIGAGFDAARILLDIAKEEAGIAGGAAKVEAERLEIAMRFADERRRILELLKNETLTAEQRNALEQQLGALPGRQRAAEERLGSGLTQPVSSPLIDTRSLTGAAMSTSAGVLSQLQQLNKSQAKVEVAISSTKTLIDTIVKLLGAPQTINVNLN